MKYAIAFDDGATVYWVTRYNDTDNYTMDRNDATLFPDRPSARCLMRTLALGDEHFVTEINNC